MKIDVRVSKRCFNPVYLPYLEDETYTQIFYGGSSSGKSYFLAQRVVWDMLKGGRRGRKHTESVSRCNLQNSKNRLRSFSDIRPIAMTPQTLSVAVGCSIATAQLWGPHLAAAMNHYDLNTPERAAMFLAQVGHESAGLSRLVENLNYAEKALLTIFGRHRISIAQARQFGRNELHPADPEGIANTIYGGEWGKQHLGNTEPGDGWLYRGRGAIQTTGRANYRGAYNQLRIMHEHCPDFVAEPHKLAEPEWAAWAAAMFCGTRPKFLAAADALDVPAATRVVNGGSEGLDDRRARYAAACKVLQS